MPEITTLIYDPSPGITPGTGEIIRTDMYNAILDLLNGISSENYNLVQKYRRVTGNVSAALADFFVDVDATSGNLTITLPSAADTDGIVRKIMAFKKSDTGSNTVTIQTVASQTIDGSGTSRVLSTPGECLIIQSDGTNWIILAQWRATFPSGYLKVRNPGDTFSYNIAGSAIGANRTLTLPLLTGDDTVAVLTLAQQFTTGAKTFNSSILKIRNPGDTFSYTIVASALGADYNLTLPLLTASDTVAVLALAQTFTTGAKTFNSSILKIRNPGDTFSYTIVASAIAADRNLTLPLITGSDTVAVLGLAQTFGAAQTFSAQVILNSGASPLAIFNSAGTFKYTVTPAAIAADRTLNLPLITGTDTLACLGLAQTFSAVITFSAKITVYGTIDTIASLAYSATTDIDFDLNETVTLDITGNITFTTSNKAAGKRKTIKILADGSTRTFTFPSWKFIGAAAPASIAANKTAILTLECFSTTDASIVAAYAVEP